VLVSQYEGPYFIVLNFEAYVKFMERWHYAQKQEALPSNLVALFLKQHNIYGIPLAQSDPSGVHSSIRFTIAVEHSFLKRWADKLRAALL
jgi:hypothetical protein